MKSHSTPSRQKNRASEADRLVRERAAQHFPGLAPRIAASHWLSEILSTCQTLDERLTSENGVNRLNALDERDQILSRAIVIVALRHLGTIRRCLAHFLKDGIPKHSGYLEGILLTGAAQLLYMESADHAVVDLAVRAVRLDPRSAGFASLTNAVLRNIIREREALKDQFSNDIGNTPSWLATRWQKHYGEATAEAIMNIHRFEPSLDLTLKSGEEAIVEEIEGFLLPTGSLRLATLRPIPLLPGFREGKWWVQDVAASLPARLLNAHSGMRIGDLCAAPGGKTAQLAQTGAEVIAVDRSAERLKRLQANLERLNLTAEAIVADVTAFKSSPFDAILLDAPCSSTGTIRRHPDIAWTKRHADITALQALQTKMLDQAAKLLNPKSILVYSVCSLEPEEGELQIAALLRRNPDLQRLPIDASEIGGLDQCLTALGEVRTLPCHLPDPDPRRAGMDGFFAARLIRRS